jgi:hypothetical protein
MKLLILFFLSQLQIAVLYLSNVELPTVIELSAIAKPASIGSEPNIPTLEKIPTAIGVSPML